MKRRLNLVRCSIDDFRCVQPVKSTSATGFSLIELMAVAAILLLLAVLYWGPRSGESRERQARKECQNQLQRIYMALDIYANEHAGRFPAATNARTSAEALDALVPRYTVDTSLFICPGIKNPPAPGDKPLRQQRISYAYYMGRRIGDSQGVLMSDEQANPNSKNPGQAAFSDTGRPPGNNHGKIGGNLLFCDGRAESSPPRIPFSLGLTQGVVLLNPYPNAQ